VDEFKIELQTRGVSMPGELLECGLFEDLMWSPCGDSDYVISHHTMDPAFTITAYTRWVALARILDEIRFYAAPIPEGAPSWWWSGEDPDRVAAVRAEADEYEIAIFNSVSEAVTFTLSYLAGAPFGAIEVVRIAPSASRYQKS